MLIKYLEIRRYTLIYRDNTAVLQYFAYNNNELDTIPRFTYMQDKNLAKYVLISKNLNTTFGVTMENGSIINGKCRILSSAKLKLCTPEILANTKIVFNLQVI